MRIIEEPIGKDELARLSRHFIDEDDLNDLVEFDSMINIRPAQNNRSRYIEDAGIRDKIKAVAAKWLK